VDVGQPEGARRRREVVDEEEVGSTLPDGYLDLYKLAVEMADRVSARRTTANSFFLAVQTALVAVLGVDGIDDNAVATAGLVLAGAWWLLLRSYRKLNSAKFAVIGEMEKAIPVAIFGEEWRKLKGEDPAVKQRLRDRYAELSLVEQVVPAVFAAVYLVVLLTS
jgi:hypothetical protein